MLAIDRTTCTRCVGTDEAVDRAIAQAAPALAAMDIAVEVRHPLVDSEDTAARLRLVSSPTIRIDGADIQPQVSESVCAPCSDLTTAGQVDCRVWIWQGEEFTSPPEGLVVEALMRAALSPAPEKDERPFTLPANLRAFFSQKKRPGAGCCG